MVEATFECSFVTQVRNIERAGGSLAVIIDSKNEDVSKVMLSDDGTGAGIRIPAVLINKLQGDILKEHLAKASEEDVKTTFIKVDFESSRGKNNIVNTEFWYTSSDDRSLDLIADLAEYIVPIDGVTFQPKFVTWSCTNCDDKYKSQNCYSDGKYCAMQHSEQDSMNGVEILHENLVHYCIFQLEEQRVDSLTVSNLDQRGLNFIHQGKLSLWFAYMKLVHELCRTRIT